MIEWTENSDPATDVLFPKKWPKGPITVNSQSLADNKRTVGNVFDS
jgi:hypothetical protein